MKEVPFFIGQDLSSEYFFDRVRILNELKQKLISQESVHIALVGERLIGKTSIIDRLAGMIDKEVIPVTIKCDKLIPKNRLELCNKLTVEILNRTPKGNAGVQALISQLKEQARLKTGSAIIQEGEVWLNLELTEAKKVALAYDLTFELISGIQKALSKRLVVFLDEFQELFSFGAEYQPFLLKYMAKCSANFVVSGSNKMLREYLSDSSEPFYNFFTVYRISPISIEECGEYITLRLNEFGIRIEGEVLKEMLRVCSGRPYYVQLIGSRLYDVCKRMNTGEINWDVYKTAFEEILRAPPVQLISVFNRLKGKTKTVFAAMCLFAPKNSTELGKKLIMLPSHVTQLLTQLCKIHGLLKQENDFFAVEDEMLKEWVKRQFGAAAFAINAQISHKKLLE